VNEKAEQTGDRHSVQPLLQQTYVSSMADGSERRKQDASC